MLVFGKAALLGLCIGLIWGVGCSLVLLYSIYLAGYRKGVRDSMEPEKSKRYMETLEKMGARPHEKRD